MSTVKLQFYLTASPLLISVLLQSSFLPSPAQLYIVLCLKYCLDFKLPSVSCYVFVSNVHNFIIYLQFMLKIAVQVSSTFAVSIW